MARGVALAAGIWLAVALAGPAAADANRDSAVPSAPGIAAAVGGDEDVRRSVLVGPGGQIYRPDDAALGTWRRPFGGGVAIPVRGAVRVDSGTLFVAGPRAPIFRLDESVWHAHPLPNRGRTTLGVGGAPVLGVGRHVYTWRERGWVRLGGISGRITAVWAADPTRAYAATTQGDLVRVEAGGTTKLPHPLAPDDGVEVIVGHPRARVYAWSRQGVVLRLGRRAATEVARAPSLADWEPQAAAVDGSGTLWILGWIPARDAAPAQALMARTVQGTLTVDHELSGLPAGDRFSLLRVDRERRMLFATASGVVRVRPGLDVGMEASDAAAWADANVLGELPTPVSVFPPRPPARTR